jgi:tRNA/tmRNA/rRNA uracil-C5-methylase (TrmA/RlmC/RlmD family)
VVTEQAKSYLRADAVEILQASPERVSAPCPYAGPFGCGGCDWQHVALGEQRSLKAQLVAEQLRSLAGVDAPVHVTEVDGSPDGLRWRTRVRFGVDGEGRVGFYKHRSHEMQVVEGCLIASSEIEAMGVEGFKWAGFESLEIFASPSTGAAVISARSPMRRPPSAPAVPCGLLVNGRLDRQPARVSIEVSNRRYRVGARSFWQVHREAAQVLANAVLEAAQPREGERVADLYSGAGLFARLFGDVVGHKGSVLAVERDRFAFADAKHNIAGLSHVEVLNASVTPRLVSERLSGVDLVVADPARLGAGRAVMGAIAALMPHPRRLVYVACDPASFARDLGVMLEAGWTLESLDAYDLFPMTEHVELVAVIEPPQGRTTQAP